MPTPIEMQSGATRVFESYGTPVLVTNYPTITFDADGYDDEQLISASGTSTSGAGILQPIGNSDRSYVEAGLVTNNDNKLFLPGSIPVSGNSQLTIGNTGSLYQVLPQGIRRYDVSGVTIYQTVFVREIYAGQHPGVQ